MSLPNTLALAVKNLGLSNYKTGNKVWLVSLDPKFGHPFVEATIIDDALKNNDVNKVECALKYGLSEKVTPHGLDRVLGEMLVIDGLTRDDERVVTTPVHEAQMLQLSLNAMDVAGIGYTSFTHYPTFDGETGAIRPKTPYTQCYNDSEVKIVDFIVRCNDRSKTESSINMATQYTFDIASIIELKTKAKKTISEIEETKAFAEKNPTLKNILKPEALVTPPLYLEMLQLKHTYELKIPTNQDKSNHKTTLEV
jgi:hypothetical protein